MLNIEQKNIKSPVRTIKGKAELFNSSAISATGENISLLNIFPQNQKIKCTVRSKNCIYYPYFNVSGNINGITYTVNSDNTITATGTATEDSFFYMVQTMNLPKGTYTLSSDDLTVNNELRCAIYNTDNTLDRYVYNGTFTIDGDRLVYIYLVILKGNTVNNVTYKPMLEKGTYSHGYTKYISDLSKVAVYVDDELFYPDAKGVIDNIYPTASNMYFSVSSVNAVLDVEYRTAQFVKDITYKDNLKAITIERAGESKFFGFGICQKAKVVVIDRERKLNFTTDNFLKPYFTSENEYINSLPYYYIDNIKRDENTNEIELTAYDALYRLSERLLSELELVAPYTLKDVVGAVCGVLGCSWNSNVIDRFGLSFPSGANVEGTENLREILNAVAEVTQTIYYIDYNNNLYFKALDRAGSPVLRIGKSDYFTLTAGENRKLGTLVSATELGDNISVGDSDLTQYIRNNPFWELREDLPTLLDAALVNVGGLAINEFECEWRGNYLLEIGDKLGIVTKDNAEISAYLLDEVLEYSGSLNSSLKWTYETKNETPSNPATLGEALKLTYARVDKANKEIELVVSDVNEISQIQINTNNIVASVSDEVDNLAQKVEATVTKEDVKILIQEATDMEITEVTTTTGFTFNADGLTVSKSGSEMTTQITEDGMKIYKGTEEVLNVDNVGIKAENLHSTTYLIMGKNSRFEDYVDNRTGCFWVG